MDTTFQSLTLTNWRQFSSVRIAFDGRATVITGANGVGKTTLLRLLATSFQWKAFFYSSGLSRQQRAELRREIRRDRDSLQNSEANGSFSVYLTNGTKFESQLPSERGRTNVNAGLENRVDGIFLSAHQAQARYQVLENIPVNPVNASQMHEVLRNATIQYDMGTYQPRMKSPGLVLKEAIVSLAVFGEATTYSAGNTSYKYILERFQECLTLTLPKSLGFIRLYVQDNDVLLHTESGHFPIDSMSGGITAVLMATWQFLLYSIDHSSFTVVWDEPENHLHPEMQRTILPSLIDAFPSAKFIISSHSPFVVSSIEGASVYVLRYDDDHRVYSELLDTDDVAGSASEVLLEVLGVGSTMPVWIERRIKAAAQNLTDLPADQRYRELRDLVRKVRDKD